jgi:uncharacterized protein YpuA (DUF1002 family)
MSSSEFEEVLSETKRAAKDLAQASARLTKKLVSKADTAAKDPAAAVGKAARRVAKELESMSQEIERLIKDL